MGSKREKREGQGGCAPPSPELFHRALLDLSNDFLVVIDRNGLYTYLSPQVEKILGYEPSELLGKHFRTLAEPKDEESHQELFHAALNGNSFQMEGDARTKDGRTLRLSARVAPRVEGGEVVGALGFVRDVTAERTAQEALQESEQRLRDIIEHSTNLFYLHTPDHVLTYMSPQTRAFFDCEPEEALIRWTELATDHPVNALGYEATQRAIDTGEAQPRYQLELKGKKGRIIWVEVDEAPVVRDGRTVAVVGALNDITKRKRAEEALLAKNRQLTALLAASQAMSGFTDLKQTAKTMCDAAVEAFGARMAWIGLIVPETTEVAPLASSGHDEGYTEVVKVRWDESPRGQGPGGRAIRTRRPVVTTDGDPNVALWRQETEKRGYKAVCVSPLLRGDEVRGILAVYSSDPEAFDPSVVEVVEIFARQAAMAIVDSSLFEEAGRTILELGSSIEELKAKQLELEVSEARYKALAEAAKDMVFIIDRGLRVAYANSIAARQFGASPAEIAGRPKRDLFPKKVDERQNQFLQKVFETGEPFYEESPVEFYGRAAWIGTWLSPIKDEKGEVTAVLGVSRDITELKQLREEIKRR